jgi:ATP-dependent Lon protease
MAPSRIPIFPLEVVLFPGELLPLHIFEPRYKEMIRDCTENKQPFGVVFSEEDSLAEVACTAEIMQILKTYDTGELDIITVGRRVCRILEVVEERSYYEAEVEYLEEGPTPTQVPSTALLQLFDKCHQAAFERAADRGALSKAPSVSYHIAGILPLDLTYKQKLLEMRDEEERRHSLELSLAKWLEQTELADRARRLSGGNGHPHYGPQ